MVMHIKDLVSITSLYLLTYLSIYLFVLDDDISYMSCLFINHVEYFFYLFLPKLSHVLRLSKVMLRLCLMISGTSSAKSPDVLRLSLVQELS